MHKRYLFRVMFRGIFRFLKSRQFQTSYLIMPRHVKLFMDGCGFQLHRVETAMREVPSFDSVRRPFAKYWHPDAEKRRQPALYKLDFQINPLVKTVENMPIFL